MISEPPGHFPLSLCFPGTFSHKTRLMQHLFLSLLVIPPMRNQQVSIRTGYADNLSVAESLLMRQDSGVVAPRCGWAGVEWANNGGITPTR
jgi:hypothetical protein